MKCVKHLAESYTVSNWKKKNPTQLGLVIKDYAIRSPVWKGLLDYITKGITPVTISNSA